MTTPGSRREAGTRAAGEGRILVGIDTSTDVRAGLAVAGRVVASAAVEDRRAHAEQLVPLVRRLLADAGVALADVDGFVVGVGPGPFTGLRVGVVTAATLAEVLGVPVRGVCSLDAVAAAWSAAAAPGQFVVVSDARRREVYWARYDATGRRTDGPFVTAPDAVPSLPLAGPGASLVPGGDVRGPVELDAGVLAARGDDLAEVGLEPLYLRRPDAEVPKGLKSTLGQPRLALGRNR